MHMQFFDFVRLSVLIKIHGISGQFLNKSLMTSILKIDVSRYGHPMRIQCRLSQELLQLFALYLHL